MKHQSLLEVTIARCKVLIRVNSTSILLLSTQISHVSFFPSARPFICLDQSNLLLIKKLALDFALLPNHLLNHQARCPHTNPSHSSHSKPCTIPPFRHGSLSQAIFWSPAETQRCRGIGDGSPPSETTSSTVLRASTAGSEFLSPRSVINGPSNRG